MTSLIQNLLQEITHLRSDEEFRLHVLPRLTSHFAAKRSGLFVFDQLSVADRAFQQVSQLAFSVEYNPVVRYLVERHAPVHEALVVSPKTWRAICPRTDHRHVMAGPIVCQGQLVGAIGFTREQGRLAFDDGNLADLSALCLHVSTWMVLRTIQTQPIDAEVLTSREHQIAELVAQGLTNADIGNELWISENSVKKALKRMFRKLQVSSRAQMVAKLSRGVSSSVNQSTLTH